MATIKFSVRGKSNTTKINVRLSISRELVLRSVTPLIINPNYFNNKTGKVRRLAHYTESAEMQEKLNDFEAFILKKCNNIKTENITGNQWLKNVIDEHFNIVKINDINYLYNYSLHYVELLKIKRNDKSGTIGSSQGTIKKHKTIAKKIKAFETYKKQRYLIADVGLNFRNEFLSYLLDIEKLGRNTAGRYIKFLKTICLNAKRSGCKVNDELDQIKGFVVEVDSIYLNFSEIEKIELTNYKDEKLNFVRDWLVIGCYIGQRMGDLLSLTNKNITYNGNLEFIELKQEKTGKKVSILIHPKVKQILKKYNNNFPPKICDHLESAKTLFNKYLKDVGRLAGLNELITGAKTNPNTGRKESGVFHKWELITSHICRRSFASNYYGTMPTALIINITGHSTERQLLTYIGKSNIDYATEMAKYWNIEQQKQEVRETGITAPLRVVN